jgi:hypothetical protein
LSGQILQAFNLILKQKAHKPEAFPVGGLFYCFGADQLLRSNYLKLPQREQPSGNSLNRSFFVSQKGLRSPHFSFAGMSSNRTNVHVPQFDVLTLSGRFLIDFEHPDMDFLSLKSMLQGMLGPDFPENICSIS